MNNRPTPLALAHQACLARRVLPPGAAFPGTAAEVRDLAVYAGRISLTLQGALEAYADALDYRDEAMALPPGERRMPLLLKAQAREQDAAAGFRVDAPVPR